MAVPAFQGWLFWPAEVVMHALPLDVLPEFERRVEALFTDPEHCRKWSGRYWFPWQGHWRANPQRAAALRRLGLCVGLGLCGLRSCEVLAMRVRDVGLGEVFVRSAKGGYFRTVVLGCRLADALLALVAGRDGSELAFRSFRSRALSPQDLENQVYALTFGTFGLRLSFHCLRHTAALRMYTDTRDVLAVRRLLGHRSLSSTWAYLCQLEPVSFPHPPFSGPPVLRVFAPQPPEASAG